MLAAMSGQRDPDTLLARLKRRIQTDGPLTVADYMEACLSDPEFGYYTTRDPFGTRGDFTTAPEVSQIFGELIGLWSAVVWRQIGSPKQVAFVELGPGRGTLMDDALRAAKTVPEFRQACEVHLVETSPVLQDRQAERLEKSGAEINWYRSLADIPAGPTILIANEFLDALPVRQFINRQGNWFERYVGLSENGELEFQTGEEVSGSDNAISECLRSRAHDGDVVECRPCMDILVGQLAERAQQFPLMALFIDYGHNASGPGETLQAVRVHDFANPLETPGEADLTAHVDFGELGKIAVRCGLRAYGPIAQGHFLLGLGLKERCEKLMSNADPSIRNNIASGAQRLADPAQMGELFKVMAVGSSSTVPPAFPNQHSGDRRNDR
ncbi:MAG: class I SAM-dependent methyltransferase [Hyphomicrobiaceae bacterium]|nr:class I SAM-dependent methyltransferase [Hyphomicrobiaceae bacterium]